MNTESLDAETALGHIDRGQCRRQNWPIQSREIMVNCFMDINAIFCALT